MARSWPGKERWKKAVSKGEQTLPEAGKQAGVQHDSDFRRESLKNVSSSSFWGTFIFFFTTPKL